LGNYALAMAEFERAIKLNPKDGIAYFNIGMMYYRVSNPGEKEHELALSVSHQVPTILCYCRGHHQNAHFLGRSVLT
jgi:hypothetical protein